MNLIQAVWGDYSKEKPLHIRAGPDGKTDGAEKNKDEINESNLSFNEFRWLISSLYSQKNKQIPNNDCNEIWMKYIIIIASLWSSGW